MSRARYQKFFDDILSASVKKEASDIHLKTNIIPVIRRHGALRPLTSKAPPITEEQMFGIMNEIMNENDKVEYEARKQVDLAYTIENIGRFRINAFTELGRPRMVIRYIPTQVPPLSELGLPGVVERVTNLSRGLVLVTGATGSGKSTTLAAIVDEINRSRSCHILTVEDPIEFRIKDRKSIISQVQLRTDTHSFADALRAGLRQDPDVILVGEMRDKETMEMALTAAETGHLVLSTMHSSDAMETINRILATFPPHQHKQLRHQLASVLRYVVCLRLAQRKNGTGRIPAVEVLINNPRIAELIVDETRTAEIEETIAESKKLWQMQTFDQALHMLLKRKEIVMEEALAIATNPENFALKQSGIRSESSKKGWSGEGEPNHTSVNAWGNVTELELDDDTKAEKEGKKVAK